MEVLTQPHLQLFDSEDAQTVAILIPKLDKELEILNYECKTTTSYEKTEEKHRVFCSLDDYAVQISNPRWENKGKREDFGPKKWVNESIQGAGKPCKGEFGV